MGFVESLVGGIVAQRQRQPIGRGRPDQGRAAHDHGADGVGRVRHGGKPPRFEAVRQLGLVDDLDSLAVGRRPDGAVRLAVYLHAGGGLVACAEGRCEKMSSQRASCV